MVHKYTQPTGPGTTRMMVSRSSISPFVRLQSAPLRRAMKRQSKQQLRPQTYCCSFPPSVRLSALLGLAGTEGCIFQPIWFGRKQVPGLGWNSETGQVWGWPPNRRPSCWSVHAGLVLNKCCTEVFFLWFDLQNEHVLKLWSWILGGSQLHLQRAIVMYPCKVRDDLKRFLDSMMSKSGKLRKLVSELNKHYSGDPAAKQWLSWRNKILSIL